MNPLFVGIDVSSRSNVAYLMKPDGSKHSSFSVQNNPGGVKILSSRIVSVLDGLHLSSVAIGLESTSIYGDHLVYALREDGNLGRFTPKIHVLNPKQVRKFKEAYSDLPKNDFVDAFVIADNLRFGRSNREVFMDDYRYKALQTLTRARFYAIQNLAREKQHFANYLFLKCSGLAPDKEVKDTGATLPALMERFPSVDDLASAGLDDLTDFVSKSGRGRFAEPQKRRRVCAVLFQHLLPCRVYRAAPKNLVLSFIRHPFLYIYVKLRHFLSSPFGRAIYSTFSNTSFGDSAP